MRFHFTEEQDQFRDALRRFLRDHSSTTAVRRAMASDRGFDPTVWRRLADDLGVQGLHIPQVYGGSGFGVAELCIAMEEMGRALLCAPFLASAVIAAKAIELIADESQKHALLPALASGRSIATLAFAERTTGFALDGIALEAMPQADAYRLTGNKHYVLDGCAADVLLVAGRIAGSRDLSLFLVRAEAAGLQRRALDVIDPTRRLAAIEFAGTPAQLLGQAGRADAGLIRTLDIANVALANEMVGG
ncbi:MAG: acyl-CoA dehydrogenase, partial [Gammaproteobacteria bacterium]|nr:acyl-CoA dehydrogenase [Gammaproteobacteria bacterium]